jgi:hypothetical protein
MNRSAEAVATPIGGELMADSEGSLWMTNKQRSIRA